MDVRMQQNSGYCLAQVGRGRKILKLFLKYCEFKYILFTNQGIVYTRICFWNVFSKDVGMQHRHRCKDVGISSGRRRQAEISKTRRQDKSGRMSAGGRRKNLGMRKSHQDNGRRKPQKNIGTKKNGRVGQQVVRRILVGGNLERTSVCKNIGRTWAEKQKPERCRQEVVGRTSVCRNLAKTSAGGNIRMTSAEK